MHDVPRIGVTVPSRAASASTLAEHFASADRAGLASAWSYELFRDPFLMLAGAAARTTRIGLGTGIAVMSTRTPFALANAAADVDELTGGRLRLGIGAGAAEVLSSLHGTRSDHVLARTREYVHVLRSSFRYLAGASDPPVAGTHYDFTPRPLPYTGRPLIRADIPIELAAMGPRMTELAGEVADGWIGFGVSPSYITDVVLPRLQRGTRRSGRPRPSVTLQAICSIDEDETVALARARVQVGSYVMHRMLDDVVEHHGLQDDQTWLRETVRERGPEALDHTSAALVETLSLSGTPDAVLSRIAPWATVADDLVLHPPYLRPLTQTASDAAFRAICTTFAR